MRIGSLCTGIGGLDMALADLFGASHAWMSELDIHASKVLTERFPNVPNLGDMTKAAPHHCDILAAGFPCQDLSLAGKGAGLSGERSGLWFTVLEWVKTIEPEWVAIENVPALKTRGLDVVLDGLSNAGYEGVWCFHRSGYRSKNPSGFAHVNGCHQRKRLFILARRGTGTFTEHKPAHQVAGDGVASLLPTPAASRSGSNVGGAAGRVGPVRHSLDSIDKLLPTPTAVQGRNATSGRQTGSKHHDGVTLNDVAFTNTWGEYAAAVERWANAFNIAPPTPSIDGRLNAELPEWMMGYTPGWVTEVEDIPRTQQLKMIGNSVHPQAALAAFTSMMEVMS